jgi:hypothetical protein
MASTPARRCPCQLPLVFDEAFPSDLGQLVDRGAERDCADDVGRPGLLPFGRVAPHDLVEVDQVDRATTGEKGIPLGEGGTRADQHAGSVGRVHLVPAPCDEVGPERHRAMRCQLRGVDDDRHATIVGRRDDLVDRRQPPGHVRRTRDGQQPGGGSAVEYGGHIVDGERPGPVALDVTHRRPGARPRQQVRMVFCNGRHH